MEKSREREAAREGERHENAYIAASAHTFTRVYLALPTDTHSHTHIHTPTFAPRHGQVPKQTPAALEQNGRWHLSPAHVIHQDVHTMPLCQGDHAVDVRVYVCVCIYVSGSIARAVANR